MGTKSKVIGIVFNVLSFILFALAMIPSNWSDGDGLSIGFAFWAYSVIFALISTVLYTVGAFRALKSGGTLLQLLFSIGILFNSQLLLFGINTNSSWFVLITRPNI